MPAGLCQDLAWHRATSTPPRCPASPPGRCTQRVCTHPRACQCTCVPLPTGSHQPSPPSTQKVGAPPLNPRVPSLVEDLEWEGRVGRMWREIREAKRRAGLRFWRGDGVHPAISIPGISGLKPARCWEVSFWARKAQGGRVSQKQRPESAWDGSVQL